MKENKSADFLIGIGIAVFGAVVVILSRTLPTAPLGLGSRGYPTFVAILMIILGIGLALPIVLRGEVKLQFSGLKDKRAAAKIAACAVMTFAYVYLLNFFGFMLLTPFFLFALMMLFEYRKYIPAAVVSILMTASVYFLFTRVFYVFLPKFKLF